MPSTCLLRDTNMKDQAENLRNHVKVHDAKFLAVMSGKGGVGKSIFSLNYALSLAKNGLKVLLIDFDVGMGNIDLLLGQTTKLSIADIFLRNVSIATVTEQGPYGLEYIGGGTGLSQVIGFDKYVYEKFRREFKQIEKKYDYIIFDMGAGTNAPYMDLILAMDEIILITTCEPTSVTDAYSLVKLLLLSNPNMHINIVVNRSIGYAYANDLQERLKNVVQRFTGQVVHTLGSIPDDKYVMKSVLNQEPLLIHYPASSASVSIQKIAGVHAGFAYMSQKVSFLERLKQRLF